MLYKIVKDFLKKYPYTIAWRIKAHCKVINKHIGYDEKVLYALTGQYNSSFADIFNTYVIVFTNKRIILARKRLFFGYFFKSITPDMYNDLSVVKRIFWGSIVIDTIKEVITISNIDSRALPEIDRNINDIMISQRKEFGYDKNANK